MRVLGNEQNELQYSLVCKCANCFGHQDRLLPRGKTLEEMSKSLTCFCCGCRGTLERDYQRQYALEAALDKETQLRK